MDDLLGICSYRLQRCYHQHWQVPLSLLQKNHWLHKAAKNWLQNPSLAPKNYSYSPIKIPVITNTSL
jgi:hypothetical protein